jgi:WD40 repeat protein
MSSTTVPPVPGVSSARVLRVFGAHPFHTDGDLLALTFAADGTLWSVEEPGVVRRWDLDGRRQIGWHHLEDLATLWAFSPDARHLAAASDDLAVWESTTGEMVASWPQPCWVTAVAFQPNADVLAVGYDDGAVRLWDWRNQKLLHEIPAQDYAVSAVAFSADGLRFASAGEDRAIHLWETNTARPLGSLFGHTDRIPGLVWHPDGRRLYSAGWDTTVRVWDVDACKPIILLNSHASQVHTLVLSGGGSLLACADSANAIHIWDTTRNREVSVLPSHVREIRALAFNPDGRRLAFGGAERLIHVWDSEKAQEETRQGDPATTRTCLALSPDSRRLATLGAGATLGIWETKDCTSGPELQDAGALRAFAASPDGKWIAGSCAAEDSALVLWDAATGRRAALLEGQGGLVTALAFSADSCLLATGGPRSGDVWLWNIPEGSPTLLLPCAADDCSVEALAFHPVKRVLAVGGVDWTAASGSVGCVALWDVSQRRQLAVFRGGAVGLAFHPNGRRLAAASLVQTVRVWNLDENELAAEWPAHNDAMTCVAYSPDGTLLATGGDDHTVRLWDADTGVARATAELDTQVKALCFSSDGRRLYTGNANASCYELDVPGMLAEGAQ